MKSIFNEIKRTLISLFVIVIAITVSVTILVVAVDVHCSNDSYYWMPLYPDAELLETRESGYFRLRGMGSTVQIYASDDEQVDVNRWYREYRREITENLFNSDNPEAGVRGFSDNRFTVTSPEEGDGSLIYYYTECANN